MTEESKKEITPIHVDVYPDEAGERIISSKYSPEINDNGDKVRFDCSFIVPSTDEQAGELYNLTIADLIAMGTRQHVYGESVVTGMLESAEKAGRLNDEVLIDEIADALREALYKEKKVAKTNEIKAQAAAMKDLYEAHGLDPKTATQADLIAAIKAG